MSRYSLLLISVGLVILTGLVYIHLHRVSQAREDIAQSAKEVNALILDKQFFDLDLELIQYRDIFKDDSKARFSPLLSICDAIDDAKDAHQTYLNNEFYNYGKFDGRKPDERLAANLSLHVTAKNQLEVVLKTIAQVFKTHHSDFDLNEEDYAIKIGSLHKFVERTLRSTTVMTASGQRESELHQQLISLSFYHILRTLLNDTNAIGCYRNYTFDEFFPVVINSPAEVPLGETYEFQIGLGSYSSDIDPASIDLRVNGLRLLTDENGLAKFSVKGKNTGKHLLKLSATVTNPNSADTSRSESLFRYRVE